MSRPRAADILAAIRARMDELRRERERVRQDAERDGADLSRLLLPPSRGFVQIGEPRGLGPSRAAEAAEPGSWISRPVARCLAPHLIAQFKPSASHYSWQLRCRRARRATGGNTDVSSRNRTRNPGTRYSRPSGSDWAGILSCWPGHAAHLGRGALHRDLSPC
jgi:hypothetical protein